MASLRSGRTRGIALLLTALTLLSAGIALLAPPTSGHSVSGVSAQRPTGGLTALAESLLSASANGTPPHWTNVTKSYAPPARTQDMMAYDPAIHAVVLFGGNLPSAGAAFSDTWLYRAGNWSEVHGLRVTPPGRWAGSMVYDPQLEAVVLFGGRNATSAMNDTWVFRGGAWSLFAPARAGAPSPRLDAAVTFDPKIPGLLLYGGGYGNLPAGSGSPWTADSGTWVLNKSGWTNVSKTAGAGVGPLLNGKMAYFPPLGEAILVGGTNASSGSNSGYGNQTWAFVNGSWTRLPLSTAPPTNNVLGELAFDAILRKAVLFGGQTASSWEDNDTWIFTGHLWENWTAHVGVAPPPRGPSGLAYDAADGHLLVFGGTHNAGTYVENQTWALD